MNDDDGGQPNPDPLINDTRPAEEANTELELDHLIDTGPATPLT